MEIVVKRGWVLAAAGFFLLLTIWHALEKACAFYFVKCRFLGCLVETIIFISCVFLECECNQAFFC